MKKRTRITALITTLCICISLFVVGVLAATTASLSVTSTLKFSADGVYVMVDASLKQGADVETAQVLSGEGAPTGQPTYKAYSYPRMATGTTPDAPNGEPSTKHFVDSTGAQASTWAIGDITYTSKNIVVVYEFIVDNYSSFEVKTTLTSNLSDIIFASNGKLNVATYNGNVQDSSPTYSFTIPARINETTPSSTIYKIAVTLEDFMNTFNTEQISINVSFEKFERTIYDNFIIENNVITGVASNYVDENGVLTIPGYAKDSQTPLTIAQGDYFDGTFPNLKSSTTKIVFQEGLTAIPAFAFKGNEYIQSIILSNSIKTIGGQAFKDCTALQNIDIPGVTTLKTYAFQYCTSLKTINMPNIERIEDEYAFGGCALIEELTLPTSIEYIGSYTFGNCSSLKKLTILSDTVPWIGDDTTPSFVGISSSAQLFVPASLVDSYKNDFDWRNAFSEILPIE